MTYSIKTFEELTTIELYEILRLRAAVFVVEQNCVYQDLDDQDQHAVHIIGRKDQNIIAYTRIFDQESAMEYASIGRVIVSKSERQLGYGHDLVKTSIQEIYRRFGSKTIKISAQKHLEAFYEQHGFLAIGKEYLEDGIPHIGMLIPFVV